MGGEYHQKPMSAATSATSPAEHSRRPSFVVSGLFLVLCVAAVRLAIYFIAGTNYGYFRDELYYIAPKAAGPSELKARPLAGGDERTVLSLPTSIADLAFGVSRDGRSIYVARVVAEDTDVGAVRLHRETAD